MREGEMAEVVNLNRFAKDRRRAEKERQAAENRVRFGRSKAERAAEKGEAAKAASDLDGKKLRHGKNLEDGEKPGPESQGPAPDLSDPPND